jgi:aryl-alcohol dehydrogenase-like predicted oxidoreductase
MDEVMEVLQDLRREGKIRHFGLSNLGSEALQDLKPYRGQFVSLQNQYSLACRDHEQDMITMSEEMDLNPMTWGSLGQGVLTGKYDRHATFGSDDRRSREIYVNFHGEKLLKNLQIVEVLRQVAARYNKPVSAVAVRFILDNLPGSVVLSGAKRPEQILANGEALGWKLDEEMLRELEYISR